MSFWDLVNGRKSDLEIPEDRSPTGELAKGVGFAALVGAATAAIIAGGYGGGPMIGSAIRLGYRGLSAGVQGREDALLANEENKKLRRALGRIYLQRVLEKRGASPELLCRLALIHVALGYPNEAQRVIEQSIAQFPPNANTLVVASSIYLSRGGHTKSTRQSALEKAIEALNQARNLEPENYAICCALASALNEAGDHVEANECWRRASLIDKKATIGWLKQAEYYVNHSKYVEAKRCFDEALVRDNTITPPWVVEYRKGVIALQTSQLSEAQDSFRKANLLNPDWDRPLWGLSASSMQLGDFKRSLEFLQKAITLNSTDAQLYLSAGNMAERLGSYETAHGYWIQAFSLDPNSFVPWVNALNKGKLALTERRFADASQHFLEANRLRGFWQEALDLEAVVQRHLKVLALDKSGESAISRGDFKLAESIWREAITYPEVEPNAYMKLGGIAADRGDTEEALRHFHCALAKSHPLAQKAINLCLAYHEFDPAIGPC